MNQPEQDEAAGRPGLVLGTLHLAVIWTFASVQSTFDALSSGEAFALFRWDGLQIVLASIALVVLPPLILGLIEGLVTLVKPAVRWRVHLFFVGALAAAFAGHVIKGFDDASAVAVFALVVPAGFAAAVWYARQPVVRSFLSFLAFAPLAVTAFFFVTSPARHLLSPGEGVAGYEQTAGPPVVLIIFDEFPLLSLVDRTGNIDAKAYPGFARLQEMSTWYPRATTVSDFTHEAVPAMLSGEMPEGERPPSWRAFPDTVLSLTSGSVNHGMFPMCDPSRCAMDPLPPGRGPFTRFVPNLARLAADAFAPPSVVNSLPQPGTPNDPSEVDDFGKIGEDVDQMSGASVVLVHELFPHAPWRFLPSGRTVQGTGCCLNDFFPDANLDQANLGLPIVPADRLTDDEHLILALKQRHLLQVGYADRIIDSMLSDLDRRGTLDKAMIVVTADHGASLTPGANTRRLTSANAPEVLGIPLFVKSPNQREPRTDRDRVVNFDIAPTIATALGRELASTIEAIALDEPRPKTETITAFQALEGEDFQIEASDYDARFAALARHQDRQFGAGRKGIQFYSMGPAPGLHGQPVGEVPPHPGASATVTSPDLYEDVDLSAGALPAEVSGTVDGSQRERIEAVAVAVNGRIAATGWTYPSQGLLRYGVLTPPGTLENGRNEIAIYALAHEGSELRSLAP